MKEKTLFSFSKNERLKHKKQIEALFNEGKAIKAFPLKLIYLPTSFEDGAQAKFGVVVPKKAFKSAVKRNRIRRQMKECIRLNKPLLYHNMKESYAFFFIYLGREMPEYQRLNKKTKQLFKTFLEERT